MSVSPVKTVSALSSHGAASQRMFVTIGAGLSAALALGLYLATAGWEVILLGLPAVVICIAHVVITRRASRRADLGSGWIIALFILTDLALIEVSLLQVHIGDGPQWVTVSGVIGLISGFGNSGLIEPPSWEASSSEPATGQVSWLGWAILLAVIVGWFLLLLGPRWPRPLRRVGTMVLCLIVAGLLAPVVSLAVAEVDAEQQVNQAEAARISSFPAAPTTCGGLSVSTHAKIADSIWQYDAPAVGQAPVWFHISALSVEQGHAVLHLSQSLDTHPYYRLGNTPVSTTGPNGYRIGLDWITDASFADVIHVGIKNINSGAEVTWEPVAHMADPTQLVPGESEALSFPGAPPYRVFYNTVDLPTTGCYAVSATWPTGSWTVMVAVGR